MMALSTYLFGRVRYQVSAPLVVVLAPDASGEWTNHYVYADGILPAGVGDDVIAQMVAAGTIRPISAVAS
ncbi:hypothetical protein ASC59_06025 [Leifsonia sp. Root1293]|nr:hypothetical protein ASC59_06025 [Leifsonia sp. Root1293]KRA11616.1 hypothetical protein ASD61_06025 [Leifsonia sp. Root60]